MTTDQPPAEHDREQYRVGDNITITPPAAAAAAANGKPSKLKNALAGAALALGSAGLGGTAAYLLSDGKDTDTRNTIRFEDDNETPAQPTSTVRRFGFADDQ